MARYIEEFRKNEVRGEENVLLDTLQISGWGYVAGK